MNTGAVENIDYKSLYETALLSIEVLTHELAQLKRMIFGSRSEKFAVTDPAKPSTQISLDLDAQTVAACKISDYEKVTIVRARAQIVPNKPKAHPGRMKLPEHLRRETIYVAPDMDITGLKKIGEEITEILDYIPGEFFVKQIIRPKYVLPVSDTNDQIVIASLPGRIMAKFMAGEGLVAQIAVDKYFDHIPLYRNLQRFKRVGVEIYQSTINDWMKAVLNFLLPIYELHKKDVLASRYLNADETGCPVQDSEKKGSCHNGYYWVYYNNEKKMALFDYRKGRSREGPDDILKDFKGYLQTDGYSAYEEFDNREGITLIHCMAHARRKFDEALNSDKARAEHALAEIQLLYGAERQIMEQGLKGESVLQVRLSLAIPVLRRLQAWLLEQACQVLPKSPIGKAITYSLSRWEKLSLYTTDAILRIDNNLVENAIRPVVLGRKNYMFAGSHEAAQRSAMIYSLFATCRMHQINPYEWLKDVLERMHLYTGDDMAVLLPQNWKKPAV